MAISKIHPIRYSVLDAVNYIVDPDKTDGQMYVSSYACGVHTADIEFADTASYGTEKGSIKAQHLIQAFAPGEVTPSLAHEIGRKFAMEVTEGKYEFVIATHVNKDHVHNHILFNQVDFIDHKKYRGNIYCQRQIAKINDNLCASYGLSVIKRGDEKAKPYYDYKDLKTNNSNRQVLKNTIDSCINLVNDFDELLAILKKAGYEIKITNENYSFKKEGSERFIRLKSLGDRYTYDAIITRIKYKNAVAIPYTAKPKEELGLLKDLSERMDMIKNPAYKNKVALSQVKRIAATYAFLNEHGITSLSMIKDKQSEWALSIKEKRSEIKDLENKIDELTNIMETLERKEKYKGVYAAYLKSGKSRTFYNENDNKLAVYESACKFLRSNGVSPNTSSREIKARIDELTVKKDALYDEYHALNSDFKQLNIAAKNMDIIMADNEIRKQKNKDKNKDI